MRPSPTLGCVILAAALIARLFGMPSIGVVFACAVAFMVGRPWSDA